MHRESLLRFLPAVCAALTDAFATTTVRANQPDLPGRFIVFQIVMFGAALLAAVPNKWGRFVGFVLLLAGIFITGFSVGMFYLPTFFVFVWVMTRDERPPVQAGHEVPGKVRTARIAAIFIAALSPWPCSRTRHARGALEQFVWEMAIVINGLQMLKCCGKMCGKAL